MSVKELKRNQGMYAETINHTTGKRAWDAQASRYGVEINVYDSRFPTVLTWDLLDILRANAERYFSERGHE